MHVGVCATAGGADVYAGGKLSVGSLSTAHILSYYTSGEDGSVS